MSVTVANIKTFRKPGELLLKTKRKEKKKIPEEVWLLGSKI